MAGCPSWTQRISADVVERNIWRVRIRLATFRCFDAGPLREARQSRQNRPGDDLKI